MSKRIRRIRYQNAKSKIAEAVRGFIFTGFSAAGIEEEGLPIGEALRERDYLREGSGAEGEGGETRDEGRRTWGGGIGFEWV